jgi:hypothetical protein
VNQNDDAAAKSTPNLTTAEATHILGGPQIRPRGRRANWATQLIACIDVSSSPRDFAGLWPWVT